MRIEDINSEIQRCTRCRLSETRIHALCGKVVEADNKRILPLQHPAAVLHDASIKAVLVRNYQKMRLLLHLDSGVK